MTHGRRAADSAYVKSVLEQISGPIVLVGFILDAAKALK